MEIYKFNMCELWTGLSWELNNELTKTYHSVSVAITEKNWPFPLGRHICWWARLNSIKYRVVRVSDFKCTATTTTLIYKGSGGNNSQIYNFSTPRFWVGWEEQELRLWSWLLCWWLRALSPSLPVIINQSWRDMQTDTLSLSAPAPTLFAPCPVSPPVLSHCQALPSNRQDFFSVKFLIILWLGPGLEAGGSLMCVMCNQHLIVSALLSSAHCPGEGCQAGLSGSLKLLLVWRYQFLSVPLRPTTDFGCKNCSCLKYNAFWISNVISRMRNPAELQKWIWTIYIEQINLVFMLMMVKIFISKSDRPPFKKLRLLKIRTRSIRKPSGIAVCYDILANYVPPLHSQNSYDKLLKLY